MTMDKSADQIDSLIRTLSILTAAYEASDPLVVDSASFTAGFRAGSRSAYTDVICRLREPRPDVADNVTRIGGAA